jgi:hypothetical protein
MKIKICLLIACVALGVTFTTRAQTVPNQVQSAINSTNAAGVQLTPNQLTQLNSGIDNLIPLVPARYTPLVAKIIGWLGMIAVLIRAVKGFLAGGVWGIITTLFASHTPKPADSSQLSQGAAASKLRAPLLSCLLCIGLAGLMATGCTILDTQEGKVLSVTTRGLYVSVAATSNTTGTPEIKMGLGSQTMMLVPTGTTNGAITIPNVADSSTINQAINPFSTSGSETFAAGNYQVNQTNATSATSATQPIIPK